MAPRTEMARKSTSIVKSSPLDDENARRWAAVLARDKSSDGKFVFSVATTGVYCRPSCPSRRGKRENVTFHTTCAEAEAAGFRPCRRCRPAELSQDARRAGMIAEACRQIESAENVPDLAGLAAARGLSRYHFHRIFKEVTGLTPKEYAFAVRRTQVRAELRKNESVTEAIYASGFNSSSRFYANSRDTLGMAPRNFQAGGKNESLTFSVARCALGEILVAASGKGIAAILMGDDRDALLADLKTMFPKATLVRAGREFEKTIAAIVGFVERPDKQINLPLDIRGTAFQQRVWKALRAIPRGTTATYSEIAARIGDRKAVRAVARACATNPLALIVPCHRVVRADGSMAGYRWGIERKRQLLERETAQKAKTRQPRPKTR